MPSMRHPGSGGLVYSTEAGRMCPACRHPLASCVCARRAQEDAVSQRQAAGDGAVRISREKGGRGGKTVTVVRGLPLADAELTALGKRLRAACGAGGTQGDGAIEIQGDHRERVAAWLREAGYTVKLAGG